MSIRLNCWVTNSSVQKFANVVKGIPYLLLLRKVVVIECNHRIGVLEIQD